MANHKSMMFTQQNVRTIGYKKGILKQSHFSYAYLTPGCLEVEIPCLMRQKNCKLMEKRTNKRYSEKVLHE